jgi:hypothetical protein
VPKDEVYKKVWEWDTRVEGDAGKSMYMNDFMQLQTFKRMHKIESAFKCVLYNEPRQPTMPLPLRPTTPDNGGPSNAVTFSRDVITPPCEGKLILFWYIVVSHGQ